MVSYIFPLLAGIPSPIWVGLLMLIGTIIGSKLILFLGVMLFAVFVLLPMNVSPLIWFALIIFGIFFLSKGRI